MTELFCHSNRPSILFFFGNNESTADADVSMDTDLIQVAYSMGGMSIKAFQGEVDNPGYDSDAAKRTWTEVSLGLAF